MNQNETRMFEVLSGLWPVDAIENEVPLYGKSIDFVVPSPWGGLLVEANGEWWHGLDMIRPGDVRKLNVLLEAREIVVGVWDWRIEKEPDQVAALIWEASMERKITCWDWHVKPSELSDEARKWLDKVWAVT